MPDEMPELRVETHLSAVDLLRRCGFANTNSEARRLIAERGVRLDGEPLTDPHATVDVHNGVVVQRGKRKFVRLVTEE